VSRQLCVTPQYWQRGQRSFAWVTKS
jgi:hypothetical protein